MLFELATEVNKTRSPAAAGLLRALGACLGLLQADPAQFLKGRAADAGQLPDADVEALVAQRTAAKAARNFAEADRIRKELSAAGIELKDSATGTSWVRAQ